MTSIGPNFRARRQIKQRVLSIVLAVSVTTAAVLVATAGAAQAIATPVPLGTADAFAVLAGSGITNTGPTTITGDVGTDPTPSITGDATITLTGSYHQADAVSTQAKVDLVTGYDDAAGQTRTADSGSELGGQKLVAGVYGTDSALGLTGTVTLDGQGSTDGIWVFQTGSSLITASSSSVALVNGAQACNVYWQVGSSATLGTSTSFVGSILALTSISATTGATIQGRLLARNGAATLDSNTITRPSCETGETEEESSASSAASSYLASSSSASASSASEASVSSELAASSSAASASSAAAAAAALAAAESAAASAAAAAAAAEAEEASASSAASAASVAAAAAEAAYGQVRQVPVGSVDTGDGSYSGAVAGR